MILGLVHWPLLIPRGRPLEGKVGRGIGKWVFAHQVGHFQPDSSAPSRSVVTLTRAVVRLFFQPSAISLFNHQLPDARTAP
jgi:hypothetical protein